MNPAIRLDLIDGLVVIKPVNFLGSEGFAAFRAAIAGARYERQTKRNLATLDKVPGILRRLRQANFDARMETPLVRALQEETAQRWLDLRETRVRVDAIEKDFHARTGSKFFPFQRTGAVWLALKHNALLADEMGLGKTLQAVAAIPSGAPVLVLCPATLKGNWRGEIERWRPLLRVTILEGRDSFRWPTPGEVLIANYDILPEVHDEPCDGHLPAKRCPGCAETTVARGGTMIRVMEGHRRTCKGFLPRERCPGCAAFLNACPKGVVKIDDEVHKCKGGTTLRQLRSRALGEAVEAHGGRRWGLTGTPVENQPSEMWTVLNVLGAAREAFGSWGSFLELANARPKIFGRGENRKQYGYDWDTPDDRYAEHLHRVMLRRLKADVLPQLPHKMWRRIQVDIDKRALEECDRFMQSQGGAAGLERLLQDPEVAFETMARVRQALAKAKTPEAVRFIEELEEQEEPVVVFSMHRAPIDLLGKRRGWGVITGDQPPADRTAVVAKFQAGELLGLACTIQAAAEGLTLTRSAQVLFVDLSFKPTQNEQAEDRCARIGQNRGVIVTILEANHPLDRRVVEILMSKREIIAENVDAGASSEDAPVAASDLEGELRAVEEEIAQGRAIRRSPSSDEELALLENLRSLRFRKSDERLVSNLVEQADVIGLSDAQWELAARVVTRGSEAEVVEIAPAVVHVEQPALESGENGEDMASKRREAITNILTLIQGLPDDDTRAELFERIQEKYCVMCGDAVGDADHDCPFEEDDEDDEDDEEDGDDDGDEEEKSEVRKA